MLQRIAKLDEYAVRKGSQAGGGRLSKWEAHLRALVLVKVGRVLSHPMLDGKCTRFELWVDNDTPEVKVVLRYFRPLEVPCRLSTRKVVIGIDYAVN